MLCIFSCEALCAWALFLQELILENMVILLLKIESCNGFPYPVHCAEVDSFSKIETLVETTVVSSRKSDNKLPSTLVGSIDLVISETESTIKWVDLNFLDIWNTARCYIRVHFIEARGDMVLKLLGAERLLCNHVIRSRYSCSYQTSKCNV